MSRNEACACGSGQRHKHCCGALSANSVRPSQDYLEHLAFEADEEGMALGEDPSQRAFANVLRVLNKLNVEGVPLTGSRAPPIVQRVHSANDRLFRPIDKQSGGVHLGFFMFRDLFSRLYVPYIYGSPLVDFMSLCDLSDDQKRLLGADRRAMAFFEDQALDLMDFGCGFMEFGGDLEVKEHAGELIYRSHVQLEAAAATATSAFDFRGTIQAALLGTELALKAGLAAEGLSNTELKAFGHNLKKATDELGSLSKRFDASRVHRAVSTFPDYVQSRYAGPQPGRVQTGHILMRAQYVASEVTRAYSDRNVREQRPGYVRSYPE
jgi:hypothetical protein